MKQTIGTSEALAPTRPIYLEEKRLQSDYLKLKNAGCPDFCTQTPGYESNKFILARKNKHSTVAYNGGLDPARVFLFQRPPKHSSIAVTCGIPGFRGQDQSHEAGRNRKDPDGSFGDSEGDRHTSRSRR